MYSALLCRSRRRQAPSTLRMCSLVFPETREYFFTLYFFWKYLVTGFLYALVYHNIFLKTIKKILILKISYFDLDTIHIVRYYTGVVRFLFIFLTTVCFFQMLYITMTSICSFLHISHTYTLNTSKGVWEIKDKSFDKGRKAYFFV